MKIEQEDIDQLSEVNNTMDEMVKDNKKLIVSLKIMLGLMDNVSDTMHKSREALVRILGEKE